jgi:hypothetical protein
VSGNFEIMKIKNSHTTIPEGKRIVMEYTGDWQPVGKSGSKFRRLTGKHVRSSAFVRISDNWSDVPPATREDLWSSLMVCINYVTNL